MKYSYKFSFFYRETKTSEPKKERFFINSDDKNGENACEIAMLQYIKKHNYYSARLESYSAI